MPKPALTLIYRINKTDPAMSPLNLYSSKDFPAYLPKLNRIYEELFTGGKGFRSKLVGFVAEPIGLDKKTELLLNQTIEFIHNASLLHDDLVDRSHLRRGKKTAWLKYTPEYAVLAGDYLLARVMVNLSAFGNISLVQYTSQVISDLLEGEWLQDSIVGDYYVNLQQLDQIHNLKTASLFKWCLRAPFIAQQRYGEELHELLEKMGTILGQLFQRGDDLLDYNIRNEEGKSLLGDLKSGYLNSFGTFLTKEMATQQIELFIKSKDLEDIYSVLGKTAEEGKATFLLKIAKFDEMNTKLIELYFHYLEQLRGLLQPAENSLIDNLRPLTDILYWRQKPS